MKISKRTELQALLDKATAWLCVHDIMTQTGYTHSSVGRALRVLWAKNTAIRQRMVGDRYGRMQWASTAVDRTNFKHAVSPAVGTYIPTGKRAKKIRTRQPPVTNLPKVTYAPTNQGALLMQIEQGVEAVVSDWVALDKKFTAHDVTVELRDRVSKDTVKVDPGLAGTVRVGGRDVAKIEHDFVRTAVHTLMGTPKFGNYTRLYTTGPAGGYWEYMPSSTLPITPATVDDDDDDTSTSAAPVAQSGGSYNGNPTIGS